MKIIRTQGKIFVAALPQESVTANMARRVLKLIREEYDTLQKVNIVFILDVMCANWHTSLFRRKLVTTT